MRAIAILCLLGSAAEAGPKHVRVWWVVSPARSAPVMSRPSEIVDTIVIYDAKGKRRTFDCRPRT